MTSLKDIDSAIEALSGKITSWQKSASEKRDSLQLIEKRRDRARSAAIRDGDAAASLELVRTRQALAEAQLEVGDLEAEIAAANKDIEKLQDQRAVAVKADSWQKAQSAMKVALTEAEGLESALSEFIKIINPHADRLLEISRLAEKAGVSRNFDCRHLFRRLNALLRPVAPFHVPRQGEAYSKPYPEILKRTFDSTADRIEGEDANAVNE